MGDNLKSKGDQQFLPRNTAIGAWWRACYKLMWLNVIGRDRAKKCREKKADYTSIDEKDTLSPLLQYGGMKSLRTDEDRNHDSSPGIVIPRWACPSD